MNLDCSSLTLEEIKDRFASDWGHSRAVTDKFSEDILRATCQSNTPHLYLRLLSQFKK